MTQEQKDKASKLWGDVKGGLEKGYNASKSGLKKAGVAIQKFSDKSVVSVEKKQLESKRKKAYTALGEVVAKSLAAKTPKPVTSANEEVAALLKEIAKFNKEISAREKALKDFEKGGASKAEAKTKSKTVKKTASK